MKRPITFRLKKLHPDLAPLVERHCGIRDFLNCTYFGRGVRGDDEVEYILVDERLYALWFVNMDVSFASPAAAGTRRPSSRSRLDPGGFAAFRCSPRNRPKQRRKIWPVTGWDLESGGVLAILEVTPAG